MFSSRGRVNRVIVVRLPAGADLIKAIRESADRANVDAGVFMLIGALKKAVLRFYIGGGKYKSLEFKGPLEIASCSGNISKKEGETFVHAHIVLSDQHGRAFGGHLGEGCEISPTGELFIYEISEVKLKRVLDEETGLSLLSIQGVQMNESCDNNRHKGSCVSHRNPGKISLTMFAIKTPRTTDTPAWINRSRKYERMANGNPLMKTLTIK